MESRVCARAGSSEGIAKRLVREFGRIKLVQEAKFGYKKGPSQIYGRPFLKVEVELADCGSLDGVELFLELAVGLDAVATLKNIENICNQNQTFGGFVLERFVAILYEVCEIGLLELSTLASRESILDDTSGVAICGHALDDRSDVVRICGQDSEVRCSEPSDAFGCVAGGAQLLVESISKQSIDTETMMAACTEDIITLDNASVVLHAYVCAECERKLDVCGQKIVVF